MRAKIIYRETAFANRREDLIDMCNALREAGKRFLYILPSQEAVYEMRHHMYRRRSEIDSLSILTLEEFKEELASIPVLEKTVIDPMIARVIIDSICGELKGELLYFGTIAEKDVFKNDIYAFIVECKGQGISSQKLHAISQVIDEKVLRDKLQDLLLIYSTYEERLRNRDIYDINDIATITSYNMTKSPYLLNMDTIVLDGFTHLALGDVSLLKSIADMNYINICINAPYINSSMKEFIDRELIGPLVEIGFRVGEDSQTLKGNMTGIDELAYKIYEGEEIDIDSDNICIKKYPCIRSEIWGIGKDIERKLKNGVSPHKIALYIEDLNEQSKYIFDTFKRLGIPIAIDQQIPISASILGRELIVAIRQSTMEHGSLIEWLDLVRDYLEKRGEDHTCEAVTMDRFSIVQAQAYRTLHERVEALRLSLNAGHIDNRHLTRENFSAYFIKWILSSRITIEEGTGQGIKVLDLGLAKGQAYDHVYILGMNDGIIPSLPNDIDMLNIGEREILRGFGINYRVRSWEFERQKIELSLALSSAKRSLTLSYRDTNKGDESLIPSPFIQEIKLVSGIGVESIDLSDRFQSDMKATVDLSVEKRIYAHRRRGIYFNNYEGIVPPHIMNLDDSFYLGATDIDTFYFCPYSLFMGKVMGGSEFEQSPIAYDNMDAGSFYHFMLGEYYRDLSQFESLDEDRLFAIYTRAALEAIRELDLPKEEEEREREEFFRPLYETVAIFIAKDLKRLDKYERDTGRILRPIMLESSFRDSRVFGVDMRARVDRVDMEYEIIDENIVPTGKFIVYDYKKSKSRGLDHILQNNICQLSIYYYLVYRRLEEMGYDDLDCMALLYYGIEENGQDDGKAIKYDGIYRNENKRELGLGRKHYAMDRDIFIVFLEYMRELTLYAIDQIREGRFYYAPNCPIYTNPFIPFSCRYADICGYNDHKIASILKEGGKIQYGEPFKGI